MDEVRRFFRYSLPGIVCVLELILVLFISNRDLVEGVISSLQGGESVAVVFGLLLGTGGLGYIFAQMYWALSQTRFFEFLHADSKRALKKLHPKYLLIKNFTKEPCCPPEDVYDASKEIGKKADIEQLSQLDTWVIGSRFLLSRREVNKSVQGILTLSERLVDVTHNLGATFIGTVLTAITWYVLHFHALRLGPLQSAEWLWSLMIWIVLLLTFSCAYYRVLQKYESLNNSALIDLAMSEYKCYGKPSEIFFIEPRSIRFRKHS